MAGSMETDRYKLKQELEMIGPVLVSTLQKAEDCLKGGDVKALQLLAEGKGTCCLKFKNEWNSSMPLENNKQSEFLCILLALLWQNQELKQKRCDPLDLKTIARQNQKIDKEKIASSIILGNDKGFDENSEDDAEALSEEGINFLIGPYEIDMAREDLYHSLFDDFRNKYERRQRHFLNSKHLPKARKLSGIDIYRYGFNFNKAVLEKAAASLEELIIDNLDNADQLDVLKNLYMPKLRRLTLWLQRVDEKIGTPSFVFPAPLEGHIGIRYLRAHMPRPTLESLLYNNANTLQELHLKVGTDHSIWDRWPYSCRDLDKLLLCCKGTLRRLVLVRDLYTHTRASCKAQVESLKHNYPGLTVTCEYCCSK